MTDKRFDVIILGGGLTGLSAGETLSRAGMDAAVFESDSTVGGISKTIEQVGFRFDLGGHRFFTKDVRVDGFIRGLMGSELIEVPRKSKILLRGKYFDYPLRPVNALFGMGIPTTLRILGDYSVERIKRLFREPEAISLEDWVVAHFGRTMYDIYFKEYSEKVWGIDCSRISAEWVAQRIKGLSLSKAIGNAFFHHRGKDVPSLVDEFVYPRLGIGRIADRLKEEIEHVGTVRTNARIEQVNHTGFTVDSVVVREGERQQVIGGSEFISTIPVTRLVTMLDPAPPDEVMTAASRLRFRDLVVVAVMIDRERVTDQTWIYIPERGIPFGRIHEPTNWSSEMAPPGKTLLVMEFFSYRGDEVWNARDDALTDLTVSHLEGLGFINRAEVLGSMVVRVPKAYPLFEVGFKEQVNVIADYLARFTNLHTAGRAGMFRYYNMDHAISSGMDAA